MKLQPKRGPVAAGTFTLAAILCVGVWGSMSGDSRRTEVVGIVLVLAPFVLAGVAAWMLPQTAAEESICEASSAPAKSLRGISKRAHWIWGGVCGVFVLSGSILGVLGFEEEARAERYFRVGNELKSKLDQCEMDLMHTRAANHLLELDRQDDFQLLRDIAKAKGVILPSDQELAVMRTK